MNKKTLGGLIVLNLALLGTLALQGSILQWSFEHRKHHAHVDTDEDPYSIKKGFWYAHVLWLFEPSRPLDEKWVTDLVRRPWLRAQHRWYPWFGFGSNALLFLIVGWAFGDFLGAFVIAWWTRILVSHHLTWFINSLAHMWGARTYSRELSAVDNFVIALLTVGEGYHNYHHTFASDYRNGVRWYHFDPAKWLIWSLERVGMARNVKRYDALAIRKRLLLEDEKLLTSTLAALAHEGRVELERRVRHTAEAIRAKLVRMHELAAERRRLRAAGAAAAVREVRLEYRRLRQDLRVEWREWARLCGDILALQEAPV